MFLLRLLFQFPDFFHVANGYCTQLSRRQRSLETFLSASPQTLKVSSKELTCYLAGTGHRHCQIAGVLNFTLIETDQGWWVKGVEY